MIFRRGTDGSVFHPGITKHDTLWVYNKDLCRNLPLVFQTEVITSDGLPGYRFVPPDDVFAAPSDGPGNACYCAAGDGCPGLPSGVFNVSLCQFDAPIILSWPHFFKVRTTNTCQYSVNFSDNDKSPTGRSEPP